MNIILQEIDKIVKNGPAPEDLQKVKENMLKQYDQDVETNDWWNSTLYAYYRQNINYLSDYKAAVNNLNASQIQSTLTTLMNQGNALQVVMMPAPKN